MYCEQMAKDKRDKLRAVRLAIRAQTRRKILKKVSQRELSVMEIKENFRAFAA